MSYSHLSRDAKRKGEICRFSTNRLLAAIIKKKKKKRLESVRCHYRTNEDQRCQYKNNWRAGQKILSLT